ncbi:MAG: voltage-gated potassium channel [Verrucomicrobiota bacterium]|jgi:voltage-gated potassium channel
MSKQRIWELLQVAKPGDRIGRRLDIFLLTLIALNIAAVIIGSVGWIEKAWAQPLQIFEIFSVGVFTVEYFGRVYSCVADPRFAHPITGRLRYMAHPLAVIDLAAFLPFYLPFVGFDLRFVRMFRLFRIFRVAKLGRYSTAWKMIGGVLGRRKEELAVCAFIMVLLIIMSASLMYFVENEAQPEKFSDIPSAMWWAVATLTTVAYGDVYPITPLGKLLGSLIQISGIAFFALPTAVIGAGLIEEFRNRRVPAACPHCGGHIEHR